MPPKGTRYYGTFRTRKTARQSYQMAPHKSARSGRSIYPKSKGIPIGIPNKMAIRLRYGIGTGMTSTAGSFASQIYRCNSLYDPNYTSGGDQPRHYDQFMSLGYDHYCVVSAELTLKVIPTSAVSNAIWVGVRMNDQVTAPSDIEDIQEAKYKRTTLLSPGSGSRTMRMKFNAKKFLGVSSIIGNPQFRGMVGTNPSEDAYWQVGMVSLAGGTNTIGLYGEIVYTAILTEPSIPAQS